MAHWHRAGSVVKVEDVNGETTQACNLLLLSPEIQEAILEMPPVVEARDPITERNLRPVVAEPVWHRQISRWASIHAHAGS